MHLREDEPRAGPSSEVRIVAVENGLALEQQANPDALGGPDLPVLRWLTTRFASAPVLTREEP